MPGAKMTKVGNFCCGNTWRTIALGNKLPFGRPSSIGARPLGWLISKGLVKTSARGFKAMRSNLQGAGNRASASLHFSYDASGYEYTKFVIRVTFFTEGLLAMS